MASTGEGIFISYRRADAASMAGRIGERLADRLPHRSVFLDVKSIDLGSDFEQRIEAELGRSKVILVLVGNAWLNGGAGEARSRLFETGDYVRREIAWALRAGLRIIPVLIDSAAMPAAADLPPEIAEFATKNAAEIRNSRFDDDFDNLLRAIDPGAVLPGGRKPPRGRQVWSAVAGALTGLALLLALLIAHKEITREPIATYLGLWGSVLLVPVTLVVGAVVGWRLHRRRTGADGS